MPHPPSTRRDRALSPVPATPVPPDPGTPTLDDEPFDPEGSLAEHGAPQCALTVRARILRPLVQAADERLPGARVDAALRAARLDRQDVLGGTRWVEGADLVCLLDTLRDGCPDEASWERLCRSRLRESLGPAASLAPIRHPDTLFRLLARTLPRIARGMRIEVVTASAVAVRIDVHINGPDSPAFRAWRDALVSEISRVVGMPAGRVVPLRRSTDSGADHDELLVRYPLTGRVTRLLLGLVGGIGAASVLGLVGLTGPVGMVAVAALGGVLPIALEGILSPRSRERVVGDMARTLAELDDEATGAVGELLALRERERDWARREQAAEAARLDEQHSRFAGMTRLLSEREAAVRGLSHDLRNPLVTIALLPSFMRSELERMGGGSESARAMLDDQDEAVRRMRELLGDLRDAGTGDPFIPLKPEWVGLQPLQVDIDSRLGALTWGRELTGRAVLSPTAPARVHIDRSALDRIVDNLLTNATKYTTTGSIRVELDGTPEGGLVLLVRDTGRGIAVADQRGIFHAGASEPSERAAHSQGVGLSVVLRLVDQLGGTLSLRSAPGEGSRFTIRIPHRAPTERDARVRLAESAEARLDRVLRLLPL
jgi:signal transduction histidine kinase